MSERQQLYVCGDNGFHQISLAYISESQLHGAQQQSEEEIIEWSRSNTPSAHRDGFLPVPWQPPLPVRQVACAANWTGLVLQDGSIFEFGTLLGRPRPRPTRVVFPRTEQPAVTQLSCGRRFAICLTSDEHVYAWGYNGFGQFGNGNFRHSENPILVETLKPGPASRVKQVAAGANHASAILEVKRPEILGKNSSSSSFSISLYTWGANRFAQCGPPACRHRSKPLKVLGIPGPPSVPVKFSAGRHHSSILTNYGEIWTWGANSGGRLGRPNVEYPYTACPGKVKNQEYRYKDVHCGDFHTTAVTIDGDVFCWGVSSQGQCGGANVSEETRKSAVKFPREIELPARDRSDLGVTTGANHTLVVPQRNEGKVWGWGDSLAIATTEHDEDDNIYFRPVLCKLSDEKLKRVNICAAGNGHSILVCSAK